MNILVRKLDDIWAGLCYAWLGLALFDFGLSIIFKGLDILESGLAFVSLAIVFCMTFLCRLRITWIRNIAVSIVVFFCFIAFAVGVLILYSSHPTEVNSAVGVLALLLLSLYIYVNFMAVFYLIRSFKR